MAEPVDYFMQGVGLGQRSRSIRNQEDQFRTNLAERARQFDLNNDIAQSNLELRQKEFILNQENAVIENQYRIANTERVKAVNNQAKKLADDAVKFAPNMSAFNDELNLWDGVSAPPKIPSGLPKTQRAEAIAMRDDAINASKADELVKMKRDWNTQQSKLYNEGFAWMMQNNPRGLMYNAETNETYYDFNSYLDTKQSVVNFQNSQAIFGRSGMRPSSVTTQNKQIGGGAVQTTWKTPDRVETSREKLLNKSLSDFITEDSSGEAVFNRTLLDEVVRALQNRRPLPANVTDPSQINPDLLNGEVGTTP